MPDKLILAGFLLKKTNQKMIFFYCGENDRVERQNVKWRGGKCNYSAKERGWKM